MREVSRAAWRLQHAATEEMTEPDGTLLMAQFLRWLAERPRTYTDVMDAWRSAHRVRANRCGRTRGSDLYRHFALFRASSRRSVGKSCKGQRV